jgi:hypothetical protein
MRERQDVEQHFLREPEARESVLEQKRVGEKAALVEEVEGFITRYIVLPGHVALPLALWVLATYVFNIFDAFPYLAVLSPVKRCGKTRLLKVLKFVCSKPWPTLTPSEAALFRSIHAEKPTMLLDEVEIFQNRKSERALWLLAILNAGYEKGATIPRCVGDSNSVQKFDVYCPKAFAAIERLPDTLADRSIIIHMQRKRKTDKTERFNLRRVSRPAKLFHEEIARLVGSERKALQEAYDQASPLEFLEDREEDLFTPLFVLCATFSPSRLGELKGCALALTGAKAEADVDDSLSLRLLADIQEVWPEGQPNILTQDLISRLRGLEESPWSNEVELTPRKLAWLLRAFEIARRSVRVGDSTGKGYVWEDVKPVLLSYVPFKRSQGSHASIDAGAGHFLDGSQKGSCDLTGKSVSGNNGAGCDPCDLLEGTREGEERGKGGGNDEQEDS